MISRGWAAYPVAFGASLLLTLVLVPLVLRLALRKQILDVPGGRKGHENAVPYLGGLALVVAFAGAVMSGALLLPDVGGRIELAWILAAATTLALLGLVDDIRGLSPALRLGVEAIAASVMWLTGTGVAVFPADWLNALLTVVWIVGVSNAFNLLDNMDGLSAGVALIGSFFVFLIAAINGQYLVATLAVALCACALGFLKHNFHPAKIYMGDAGSLFLGFLLAVLGIKLRFDGPDEVTFFVPILILGVALFDTALVVISRVTHGRSPFAGGRDHTSHRLVFVGIPVPVAVMLMYTGAIVLGSFGLLMSRLDRVSGFLLMGIVIAVSSFLGVLLARVPVYQNSKRRRLMIRQVGDHGGTPESP